MVKSTLAIIVFNLAFIPVEAMTLGEVIEGLERKSITVEEVGNSLYTKKVMNSALP